MKIKNKLSLLTLVCSLSFCTSLCAATYEIADGTTCQITASNSIVEYIARKMLNHEEVIDVSDFSNEIKTTKELARYITEAYTQNPLIGTISSIYYTNPIREVRISYAISMDDTVRYQVTTMKAVKDIIADLQLDGLSDIEKEILINNYICDHAEYNQNAKTCLENGKSVADYSREHVEDFIPYGVLINGRGVCESYAEAFKLLAEEAGLNVILDTGISGDKNIEHEWCRVQLDDKWYIIDPSSNDNAELPNCYINLTDEQASRKFKSSWNASLNIRDYKAEDSSKELLTLLGRTASSEVEAADIILNLIETGQKGKMYPIRMNRQVTDKMVSNIFQRVAKKTKASKFMIHYSGNFLSFQVA